MSTKHKEPRRRPQIVTRPHPPVEVCDSCGAIQPFRLSHGFRAAGVFNAAPARCKECGRNAQVRYPAHCPQSGQIAARTY